MGSHEALRESIPAYVASRLAQPLRRELELHLAVCRECQDLVAFSEGVSGALHPEVLHPDPLELERHAIDPDDPVHAATARHVASCPSCALEVSAWKRRPQKRFLSGNRPAAVARPAAPFAFRPLVAGLSFGVAATLLVGLLLWPGAVPDRRLWSGSAELLLLEEPTRGSITTKRVRVAEDQPAIPLALSFSLPAAAADADRFRFSIARADGTESWGHLLTAAEIRERLRRDVVLFLVPAVDHPAGSYRLQVAPEASGETILEIPFEVD